MNLLRSEHYSTTRLQEACLIIHPRVLDRYHITRKDFFGVFEEGSNFHPLEHPLLYRGQYFYDSEGYYMAQRFDDIDIIYEIAEASKRYGESKKVAYTYKDQMRSDDEDRIAYMRRSIAGKFNHNSDCREALVQTGRREIVEFTYWGDKFFGISHDTRTGRNILGKLIMEYRTGLLGVLQ